MPPPRASSSTARRKARRRRCIPARSNISPRRTRCSAERREHRAPAILSMALDLDTKPAPTPHLPFGETGLTDDLFKAGAAGRLLFWVAVAFSVFQLVTGFNIPLDKDFWPGDRCPTSICSRSPARRWRSAASRSAGIRSSGATCAKAGWRVISMAAIFVLLERLRGRVAEPGPAHHACRIPVPGAARSRCPPASRRSARWSAFCCG